MTHILIPIKDIEKLIELYKKQGERGEFKLYFDGKVDGLTQFLSNSIATGKEISLDDKSITDKADEATLKEGYDVYDSHGADYQNGYIKALEDLITP